MFKTSTSQKKRLNKLICRILLVLMCKFGEKICNTFGGYSVPFYECLFTRVILRLSLSKFKVEVLKYLKIALSQCQSGFRTYMKMFQFCAEYRSWNPFSQPFFNFFPSYTCLPKWYMWSGFIELCHQIPWSDPFIEEWGDFLGHFVLVMPHTQEAHLSFYSAPAKSSRSHYYRKHI